MHYSKAHSNYAKDWRGCKPRLQEEVFEVFNVSASYPVRLHEDLKN